MIKVELRSASPAEGVEDGGYRAIASITLKSDGELDVWDPNNYVYPSDPMVESLFETPMPRRGLDGKTRRTYFRDNPAYWLRNLHYILRTGYLVPVVTVDDGQGELTRNQVADKIGVKPDTWSGYVARGQAPQPVRRVGRTPVWSSDQVDEWQKSRRGQGTRREPVHA